MKAFEYATPSSIDEAVSLLSEQWGETEILAGGTDLITALKQGITAPNRVVSLKKTGLSRTIAVNDDTLEIGAMTSMGDLAADETVKKHFPALAKVASAIASPQLLSVGTVGGDLCQRPRCWYYRNGMGLLGQKDGMSLVEAGDNRYHAIFGNEGAAKFVSASSLGPPLIALGATVVTSARSIPVGEFFATPTAEGERETVLKPNEIVKSVTVPMTGRRNAAYEIRHRKGLDWPYVTAAVAFAQDAQQATEVSVVLGHVAPTPWVATEAARSLEGKAITVEAAEACGKAASEGATPLSGNGYKTKMVETAVKRAVLIAAGLQAEH